MALLESLATYLRDRARYPDVHVVGSDTPAVGLMQELDVPHNRQESCVIEGDGPGPSFYRVEARGETGFTHFEDGIQRQEVVMYLRGAPVVYAYTAAVIRQRQEDLTMTTWGEDAYEALYVPTAIVGESEVEAMRSAGLKCHDVDVPTDDGQLSIPLMYVQAVNAIRTERAHLERRLLEQWMEEHRNSPNAWLAVDGGLRETIRIPAPATNLVGIAKDCRTLYFPWADQAHIYSMPAGYRSSVFQTPAAQSNQVHSWYLRLWSNYGHDLLFGIIRLELASQCPAVSIARADEISSWLLAERMPLSKPDSRWDRLIYPIHDCEEYLRSKAPSSAAVKAVLAGIGGIHSAATRRSLAGP